MEEKVNYAVVGLFVLVLGGALIAITLWLSVGGLSRESYDHFLAYFRESVSGLSVNAPVKYRGVDVGRVRAIDLNPQNPEEVRLVLDIKEGTPVKTDTRAFLSVQGLTGIAFVELTGGSRDASRLERKPGEEYPVIPTSPSLLVRLDAAISGLLASLNRLSDDMSDLLTEENRRSIAGILADLKLMTGAIAAHDGALGKSLENAASTLEQSAKAAAQLPELLARVGRSAEAVETMASEIAGVSKGFRTTLESGNRDLERFTAQTLPEFAGLLGELRELTATLQRVGRQLEQDPSVLLRGSQAPAPGPGE